MSLVLRTHCQRAISDIARHGDNDILPFDVDGRFFRDCAPLLEEMVFELSTTMATLSQDGARHFYKELSIFSERLLAPAGYSGFRICSKIHPFWNLYLNSIALSLAEINEPTRSCRAHSYRYLSEGDTLFDRSSSWRAFREATLEDCQSASHDNIVVQTDISSFYEHVYHHRLENLISDLTPEHSNIPTQVDRILNQIAEGRSFGLPIGGQAARVLAEILMSSIDRVLTNHDICWRRYVDDFVLVSDTQRQAYRDLGILANALADLGLSLNRSKTSFMSVGQYMDYVSAQLHGPEGDGHRLMEIDLHFDPYSDAPVETYEELQDMVRQIDIARILDEEKMKAQADPFVVTQISRSLRHMDPHRALEVCMTFLSERNLHAFRASWATIMRGVYAIRNEQENRDIHDSLDSLLDEVISHSSHLASIDTNALYLLRAFRHKCTPLRANYVLHQYESAKAVSVRRACIDCWRSWKDREQFTALRARWQTLHSEEQRMVWLASLEFGDAGLHFRNQVGRTLENLWALGIESENALKFSTVYRDWATNEG